MRREPIDLTKIAADFAEAGARPEPEVPPEAAATETVATEAQAPADVTIDEITNEPSVNESIANAPIPNELIIAALEAEVQRVKEQTALADAAPLVAPAVLIPLGPVMPDTDSLPDHSAAPEPVAPDAVTSTPPVGLPLEQLREWLDQVHADLQRVQLRLEFLRAEQQRLQGQHRLVEDLITTSEPV